MKVYLTSAYQNDFPSNWLKLHDTHAEVQCTNDPDLADVIIFAEGHLGIDPFFRKIHNNKIYKKYKYKCVLYHDTDFSITTVPTIAPCIEYSQYNPKHKRVVPYFARETPNENVDNAIIDYRNDRKYLYSFDGNRSNKLRDRMFAITHPEDTFMRDITGKHYWKVTAEEKMEMGQRFVSVIQDSYFVLAPRGIGPTSYRLFESMQLGRAPVILADNWPKVPTMDWNSFSVSIAENKLNQLPDILRERKHEAVEMGILARKAWEENCSPQVGFSYLSKAAYELIQHKYSFLDALEDHLQFIKNPQFFRRFASFKYKQLLVKLKSIALHADANASTEISSLKNS